MRNLWQHLTIPNSVDPELAHQEYLTRIVFVALGGLLLVFTPLVILIPGWFGEYSPENLIIMILLDTPILIGWWIGTRGYWRWSAYLPPIVFLIVGIYGTSQGGYKSIGILFFVLALLLTAFLKGNKSQWIMLPVCLIGYLVAGWAYGDRTIEAIFPAAITITGAFLGIAFLQSISIDQLEKTHRVLHVDITKRKRSEKELIESEEKYRQLFELESDAIFLVDNETGCVCEVNSAACALYGFSRDELLQMKNTNLSAEPDKTRKATQEEQTWIPRRFHKKKDGTIFPVEITERHFIWQDHRVHVAAIRDISQRVQAEEAILENKAQLLMINENLPDTISQTDNQRRIVYVSPSVKRVYGYEPQDLIGHTPAEYVHPDDVEPVFGFVRAAIDKHEPEVRIEYRFKNASGEYRWVESNTRILYDEAGEYAGLIFGSRDITERKKAEEALQESEKRFRELADFLPQPIFEVDLQGNLTFTNLASLEVFGYTAEDLYQKLNIAQMLAPEDHQLAPENLQSRMRNEKSSSSEYLASRKNGTHFPVLAFSAPLIREGELVGVRGVIVDISEIKQRERELEAVAAVSSSLQIAQNRDEMLPMILDQTIALLNAKAALIGFRDPETGEALIEQARGAWERAVGLRSPPGKGVAGSVLESGQVYLTNDLSNDPVIFYPDLVGDIQAMAAVPLTSRDGVIGLIAVGVVGRINDEDVRVLKAIADMTASAVQREILNEQTGRRLQYLNGLRTIDMAITGSFDLQITIEILVNTLVNLLGVDAVCLLLFNPHTQTLEYAYSSGFHSKEIYNSHLRLGENLAGRAALERRMIEIPSLGSHQQSNAFSRLLSDEGFEAYFGVPLIAKGNVKGVLEVYHRSPLHPDPDWLDFLDTTARQAAIAIDNSELFNSLQRTNLELALAYDNTLEGWSRALDLRDHETEGHTMRVVEMTLVLARSLGLGDEKLAQIRRGALLHDIGKMGVPDAILNKPGPLTEEEWVIMRRHPRDAYEMLLPISYLRPALEIPYCHHEKWDGTGYPRGLQREEIPLSARIFALVDVWDALRSDRPYRKAWTDAKALEYIRSQSGAHFDPQVVEAFLHLDI
jgi:PAS domain S-box-containing protein/putative nucleotidyltransferase with HDIG domain